MSRSINKVQLIGLIGQAPEKKYINDTPLVNLSLATDESYNDKNTGQKVEQTEWHRITAYGKLAEIICQYLNKGSKVYIEGKLKTREWEKDGIKRYTTEIIAQQMLMLDNRKDVQPNNQAQPYQQQAQQYQPQRAPATPPPGYRPPMPGNVYQPQNHQQPAPNNHQDFADIPF